MANQSAKRIAQENIKLLKYLRYGFLIVHIIYYLLKIILHNGVLMNSEMTIYGITSAISLIVFFQLERMGRPKINEKKELVSEGVDLNAGGMVEYMLDVIYLTWFAQLLSNFTFYGWYVLLVIPAYVLYKGTGFLFPLLNTMTAAAPEQEKSKRQEKREKRNRMAR